MKPARRYEALLEGAFGRLREHDRPADPRGMSELEIQAHWFSGDFGREFATEKGDKIRVTQFGEWNREAGPDFAQAAVSINGGEPVRGCIEIDPDAQDWERHGHATNPDYDAVVLHVCAREEGRKFFTRTSRHREVPRVRLDMEALNGTPAPIVIAKAGRCSAPLRGMPREKLLGILEAAAQFRLCKKSARMARTGELHGGDEALYQSLAVALGYKNNKLPFTLLAQRLPLAFLSRNKADLDAILFGAAGFLNEADLTKYDLETRAYLRGLWDRWWQLRDRFSRLTLPPGSWRLAAVRPANHPQRRLAALAQIVRHWPKLRALVKEGHIAKIGAALEKLEDEYWDRHFTLTSKKSAKPMALIGGSRVGDMMANIFYPLVAQSHPDRWADYMKLAGPPPSRRVKIAAVRLFGDAAGAKTILKSAANQQGMLQIYEDFCMRDDSDCAQCLFPKQLAQW